MKQKVIYHRFIPVRLPVISTVTLWLLLDRLGAPGWAYGCLWMLAAIVTVAIVVTWRQTSYAEPVFKEDKP